MFGRSTLRSALHKVFKKIEHGDTDGMFIFHEQGENTQGTTYCFGRTPQSPPATIANHVLSIAE